jgi:hypothetical protein
MARARPEQRWVTVYEGELVDSVARRDGTHIDCVQMNKVHPELKRFAGNWPTKYMAVQYLQNRRRPPRGGRKADDADGGDMDVFDGVSGEDSDGDGEGSDGDGEGKEGPNVEEEEEEEDDDDD